MLRYHKLFSAHHFAERFKKQYVLTSESSRQSYEYVFPTDRFSIVYRSGAA
jgi:hypothetical protein